MSTYPQYNRPENSYTRVFSVGIAASLILHCILLLALRHNLKATSHQPQVIEISLESLSPKAPSRQKEKTQIIQEPQSKVVETPDPTAKFMAESNRRTEREQIHRGVHPDAGATKSKSAPAPAPPENHQTPKNVSAPKKQQPPPAQRSPQLGSLRLNSSDLAKEFGGTSTPSAPPQKTPPQNFSMLNPSQYQAFSRPAGSGARFIGEAGSSDYLPSLPDGDITLLNAKANRFAVFVRRVATRVFSQLRASGWETLTPSDIRSLNEFSTVEAVLSPTGKLLEVKLLSASGSRAFDEVLLQASRSGASDPHPPSGALAADGNIHFLFQAKSWSRVGASRGGKGFAEQRWLLLSTGLE